MALTDRIWPEGTMVVALQPVTPGDGGHTRPRGACGIIVKAPSDPQGDYRIRFPDGGEFGVAAGDLEVLKRWQDSAVDGGQGAPWRERVDLYEYVEYKCIVGSRAYGLDHEGSDVDLRGFYLAPADLHWSMYGVPEQLERPDSDECYWELEKFLRLALKANPNVLECLYTPLVEVRSPLADELLSIRETFLSRMIYQTYNRYVMSQFKNMSRRRAKGQEPKPKHAMHLIRLMLSGLTILHEGFVPVDVTADRDRLLAIKHQELTWDEVDSWRIDLHRAYDEALETTSLPERPDYERANAFLLHARRKAAGFA